MSSYEHGLEFDAYQEGIKAERERIIKMLEDYQHPNTQHEFNDEFCSSLIALIKGERSKEEQIADLMWLSEQQLIAENKREGENK